ncbi:MAG TPA: hypothetical protein VII03_00780 [Solirubrobacteraceae bacterium]
MHLNWQPAPGVTNPNEPWLYGVNDPAGEVLALLDPWVDPPPGADDAMIGRWRLVRYKLQDDSELLNALEEHPEVGDLPQELKLVVGSVLGQDPKSVQTLGCERVLELVGDAGRDWVAERTERALRQLLAVIRGGAREEVLVSRGKLAELLERTAVLHDLLDDWVESGGRFTYLYGLVSAINDRRAGLLDAMDEQPTSLDEWARYLRHRMVEHLAGASDDAEMSHEQADDLSWTAAMALEAAFMVSARWGDDRALQEMLDDATNCLVDALDHGHADTVEWLACATHTSLNIPEPDAADEPLQDALGRLLAIYAHLAGAVVQAGRIGCARADHSPEDE